MRILRIFKMKAWLKFGRAAEIFLKSPNLTQAYYVYQNKHKKRVKLTENSQDIDRAEHSEIGKELKL